MSSNAKTNRESNRTPKHSILLGNVTAIIFAPVSIIQTEASGNDNTGLLRSSPTELFEAFKERNTSSMRTRLNESLEEIRLAGWISPCTLLIKGPLEELEVIKEAWRRHFLRSPEGLLIRDIGSVGSVEMEVVQQSPFLPLARALYEAIAALNKNDQPATQQSIVDFLFEAYQYVHVPKLNVIHGCLGILIKEEKIYQTGIGYFVTSPPDPASEADKLEVSPTDDTSTSLLSKKPIQCATRQVAPKGESSEVTMPQPEESGNIENRCSECGANVKENTAVEAGRSLDTGVVKPSKRKKSSTGETGELPGKVSSSSKESNPKEVKPKNSDCTDKDTKAATKEKRRHRKDSNSNSSETTSSTSERTHKKNAKDKQSQEGKKSKRNVFSQMACLMSKTFSIADVFEGEANSTVPSEECTPPVLNLDTQEIEDKTGDVSNGNSVFDAKKSSTKDKDENEVKRTDVEQSTDLQDLRLSVTRSRSFVQASKNRQDHRTRSIAFTANKVRALARLEKTPDSVARPDERRPNSNKAESVSRNVNFRRSMPPLSSSSTFPVGIVRPLTNSHTTDYRTVSRSNSTKPESSRKSSASGTPSSTPKMKDKAAGHARKSAQPGFEGHMPFRTMDNQIFRVETPLKPLQCSNAKPQTSSISKVRETAPAKTRYFSPVSHFIPGNVQKKAVARSTPPFQACENTQAPSTSAICYDNNYCTFTGEIIEHCKCYFHGAELSIAHAQTSGLLDSQDICLEEVSSSDCTDLFHVAGERYLEVKPFPPRQFVDGESRYDESLTFIGII